MFQLIRKSTDAEVKEFVTGVLWNLSPCDVIKTTTNQDVLSTLTNTVNVPVILDGRALIFMITKLNFRLHLLCLIRKVASSTGEEVKKQIRSCEVLVNALLHGIHMCVNACDYNAKTVVNCICTPWNPSSQLQLEAPQVWLAGAELTRRLTRKRISQQGLGAGCQGVKKNRRTQEDQ